MELFTPVESGRISVQVVQQIQNAIREGQLKPGDRLAPERSLAEQFGVSRVSVRDALRALEALDLIEIRVGAAGGSFVKAPGVQVVGEGLANLVLLQTLSPDSVAEARLIIECSTVAAATVRATPEEVAELQKLIADARDALDRDAYEREQSVQFHVRIAEMARNDAVQLVSESFRGALSMGAIRRRGRSQAWYAHTVDEHDAILQAIAAGDPAQAKQAMAAHLLRDADLSTEVVAAVVGAPVDVAR